MFCFIKIHYFDVLSKLLNFCDFILIEIFKVKAPFALFETSLKP